MSNSLTPEQRAIIARMRQQHACLYEMPKSDLLEVFKHARDELADSREKKARFLARIAKDVYGGTTPRPWPKMPSEAKQMASTATHQPRYILTSAERRSTALLPMTLRIAMSRYRITLCHEMVGPAVAANRTGIILDVLGDYLVMRFVAEGNTTVHIPLSRLRELKASKGCTAAVENERYVTAIANAYGFVDAGDAFLVGIRPTASPYKWELTGPIDLDEVNPYNKKSHEAR